MFSPYIYCHYRLVTMAMHFPKMCLAHVHFKANMCAKFSIVMESDSSHIPGHYQWLEQYSVTRSHWNLYMTRLTRLDSNPKMRPNDSTRPKILVTRYNPAQIDLKCFKNVEVTRSTNFFLIFCHIYAAIPWQGTFGHCQKNVSLTSSPQGLQVCQISFEMPQNVEVIWSTVFL